jgi:N-methylhydantoinase A
MDARVRRTLGVDIGGTFTDVVLLGGDGSIVAKKVLSTVDDYAVGIMRALDEACREAGASADDLDAVVHGTTVATNTILEGTGARTALITTAGFRDVLELRRIRIPQLYNLLYEKPAPLVPRRLRFEVEERLGARGEVVRPLDEASVAAALERVRRANVQALAISLLHSYADGGHERRIAAAARAALPGVFVTCSADILPEIREYERTSTTVINAYVGPIVERYLRSLARRLRAAGVGAPLRVMQSNGGVMTADRAMARPAYIVESGPAAGVIAAAQAARAAGHPNAITLDMGGTTAKASLIEGGAITKTFEYEAGAGINLSSQLVKGGGHALRLPLIDVAEIGAGGGSIVSINRGGSMQIGPRSAGAVPGPACYGAGGEEATLTDAHVVLGYINPAGLAGGRVRVDPSLARDVVERKVARPLGQPLLAAAYGVHAIASATMMRAVKAVSTYRGRDPREFTLIAFGGNGPICGVEMARFLEMPRVLVPPHPGLFSAFGLLLAHLEHQAVRTCLRRASAVAPADVEGWYRDLEDEARAVLRDEGCSEDEVNLSRLADLRYAGQAYELAVPVGRGARALDEMVGRFESEHLRTYGHRGASEGVDLVSVRVVADAPGSAPGLPSAFGRRPDGSGTTACTGRRAAYYGPTHGTVATPVIGRGGLATGARAGPLIVEEYDATCVVPPGAIASLDVRGNIVIDLEERPRA